jgi:hypothetical protein
VFPKLFWPSNSLNLKNTNGIPHQNQKARKEGRLSLQPKKKTMEVKTFTSSIVYFRK